MARRGRKRQVNVWLSPDAYQGWQTLVELWSVESLTAVIEAVGRVVADGELPKSNMAWKHVAAQARLVSEERRSRARGGKSGDESGGKG